MSAGASAETASLLRSPRTNLRRFLTHSAKGAAPDPASLPPLDALIDELVPCDADNKLHARKLYLVLDLDETLVYSQRMAPDATPVGTQIFVRGQPFDMIKRPGLQHFLRMAHQHYVVYLYTMGDQDYTQAVLKVIDAENKYFRGGVLCWRPPESRTVKSLGRAACERRMSLIVDDTVDVWANDLANLCPIRRFVGDSLDDGLMLLSWQLEEAHRAFFADAPSEGFSYTAALGSPRAPPTTYGVLADARGQLLAGCTICLTGVVNGLGNEDSLESLPLGVLIKLYGGELTMSLEAATHLDGATTGFFAVWDHWLLDTISSWQKQEEASYAIRLDEERAPSPLTRQQQEEAPAAAADANAEPARAPEETLSGGAPPVPVARVEEEDSEAMPPRKRPRPELGVNGAVTGATLQNGAVSAYLSGMAPQQPPSLASA